MLVTFLKGAILGFSMSVFFIGPSLFALIQTSLKNGFRSAAVMAFGISLSDVFLILIAYIGAQQLSDPKFKVYEGIVGSVILFVFGIVALFQKHADEKDERKGLDIAAHINRRLPLMLAKGFFLNLLNPFVLLMWIALIGVSSKYYDRGEVLFFFAGTLGMIFILDLSKSYAANRLKNLLTHKIMKIIHYVMAIALIISGCVVLYDVLSGKTPSA